MIHTMAPATQKAFSQHIDAFQKMCSGSLSVMLEQDSLPMWCQQAPVPHWLSIEPVISQKVEQWSREYLMEVPVFCKWILEVTASSSFLLYITCHIDQSWYNVGRDYKRYENHEVKTIGGYMNWPLQESLPQFGCSTLCQLHAYLNASYICLAPAWHWEILSTFSGRHQYADWMPFVYQMP